MTERLRLLFRHILYNLRGGFLVRPLIIALALGFLGALLSFVEESAPAIGNWVPAILFLSRADPQVAQIILGGIAASIMTVVSIVFAILLMTLTLASMQFSPRIIVSFARDRVTQWTLGIFLGTFLYCMAALPAAHELPRPFSPVATVVGAMLLAIICVGLLLYFIHHISQAISVNHIVDRIASETEIIIDETMPSLRRDHHMEMPPPNDLAVNDPTAAISCVDHLSRLLIRFASREMPVPLLYDIKGVARVSIRWIDFERLLDSAFEQIRMYAKGDVAVSLHLLRAFGDIAASTQNEEFRSTLLQRAQRVVAGCEHRIDPEELKPMLVRFTALKKLTTAQPVS